MLDCRAMTAEEAAEFCQALSLLLGEVSRVKVAIGQGRLPCEEEYADLVARTFHIVRDLVLETHTLFGGETS